METVAEGVETREHLDSISGAGCDEVQGFFFSHPVPSGAVGEALALCRLKCLAAQARRSSQQQQPRRPRRKRASR